MNLLGLNTSELEAHLKAGGEAAFRGRQISDWIYRKGAASFGDMKNLSGALRDKLTAADALEFPTVAKRTVASDGTTKLLLALRDGEQIETVRLPYPDRLSACVSSQAGCAVACQFCATGLGGFRRNLTAAEIIGQILLVKREGAQGETPSHVVFMGMGEPLLNTTNVFHAVELMHEEVGIPMRHITISTVGILAGIEKLAQKNWQLTLAISLHSPDDDLRHQLIPTSTKAASTIPSRLLASWRVCVAAGRATSTSSRGTTFPAPPSPEFARKSSTSSARPSSVRAFPSPKECNGAPMSRRRADSCACSINPYRTM